MIFYRTGKLNRPPAAELRAYTILLHTIPLLVREHLQADGRGDYRAFETRVSVPMEDSLVEITAKYPAGNIPFAEQPLDEVNLPGFDDAQAEDDSADTPFFDRRSMEGILRAKLNELGAPAERGDAQLAHFRELLRLNPNDNQGVRDLLLDVYFLTERYADTQALIKQYQDDWTATWLYSRALLTFRERGASAQANKAFAAALEENPFVPAYVTGRKRVPNQLPEMVGWGDESEAIWYAAHHLNYWRLVPGAVEWATERAQATPKVARKKASPRTASSRKKNRREFVCGIRLKWSKSGVVFAERRRLEKKLDEEEALANQVAPEKRTKRQARFIRFEHQ